jgi:hypothetical protein
MFKNFKIKHLVEDHKVMLAAIITLFLLKVLVTIRP